MPRKSYTDEARELAFCCWRKHGQNVDATLSALKREHGWPIARQTLYDWMAQYNWQDRAARLQAEADEIERARLHGRERVLADLMHQKAKYEKYFDDQANTGQVDPKATFAYVGLCRMILAVQKDFEREQANLPEAPTAPKGLTNEAVELIKAELLGIEHRMNHNYPV